MDTKPPVYPTLPTRPLNSKKFRYVPASKTDVRVTFEKFRRLIRLQQARAS